MKIRTPAASLPHLRMPRASANWDAAGEPAPWAWESVPALPPFVLADGSGPAIQQTIARTCWGVEALYIRFDCQDRDIWGASTRRDDAAGRWYATLAIPWAAIAPRGTPAAIWRANFYRIERPRD